MTCKTHAHIQVCYTHIGVLMGFGAFYPKKWHLACEAEGVYKTSRSRSVWPSSLNQVLKLSSEVPSLFHGVGGGGGPYPNKEALLNFSKFTTLTSFLHDCHLFIKHRIKTLRSSSLGLHFLCHIKLTLKKSICISPVTCLWQVSFQTQRGTLRESKKVFCSPHYSHTASLSLIHFILPGVLDHDFHICVQL